MGDKGGKRKMPSDDQVIKEMDVYMCNTLKPKLHVFNFPPGFDPISGKKTNLLGAKVKVMDENKKRFLMEIKIDTKSRNFDRSKSEQIAYITDHGDEPFFPNKYMNKLILKSDESIPSNLHYAIGVIKHDSDELHLTPINSVIQFRPSFDYFDKNNKKLAGPSGSSKSGDGPSGDNEEKKEEDVKKVLMRFERPDEERIKKARESSYSFNRQKMESVPWTDVNISLRDTATAMIEKQNLFLHQQNDEFMNGYNAPDVLMVEDVDNPNHTTADNSASSVEDCLKPFWNNDSANSSGTSSSTKSKNFSLGNKIHSIMMNAKVVSFNDLRQLLPDINDLTLLIRNLQQYAMIVQGNWVVKSEVLYSKENGAPSTSPLTGIPLELLCRARDYILWKFTQEDSVNRVEMIEKTKIPPEEVLSILNEVSVFNKSTKSWDFILPEDTAFIEAYPDVVERQVLLWDARHTQLKQAYSPQKPKPRKTRKSTSSS